MGFLACDRVEGDALCLKDALDSIDRSVELLVGMSGHQREADERILGGYCWSDNGIDEDTLFIK